MRAWLWVSSIAVLGALALTVIGATTGEAAGPLAGAAVSGMSEGSSIVVLVTRPPPIRLKTYYKDEVQDYASVATPEGEALLQSEGYKFVREEGWVEGGSTIGTTPLNLYRCELQHPKQLIVRYDTTTKQSSCTLIRVEGHVFTEPADTREEISNFASYGMQFLGGSLGITTEAEAFYTAQGYPIGNLEGFVMRTGPAEGWRKLYSHWLPISEDNLTGSSRSVRAIATNFGFSPLREEGWVAEGPQPGLIPLFAYSTQRARKDGSSHAENFLGATPAAAADAAKVGYAVVTIDGYCHPTQQPGTVPLKRYWNAGREEFFTLAAPTSEAQALGSGYQFVGVECYVRPPPLEAQAEQLPPPPLVVPDPPPFVPGVEQSPATPLVVPDPPHAVQQQAEQAQPAPAAITGYQPVPGGSATMAGAGGIGTATATCPGNKVAVGAGYRMRLVGQAWETPNFGLELRAVWPDGNTVSVTGRNANVGHDGEIAAIATCIDPVPGMSVGEVDAGQGLNAEALCPRDADLIGAGFRATANFHPSGFGPTRVRPSTEGGRVFNASGLQVTPQTPVWTTPQSARVRAICAPRGSLPHIAYAEHAFVLDAQGTADAIIACNSGERPLAFGMWMENAPAGFGNHPLVQAVVPDGTNRAVASLRNRAVLGWERIRIKATAICAPAR